MAHHNDVHLCGPRCGYGAGRRSSDGQYLAHARNFIACIASREAPISNLESAQRVAVATHLANLSLRLGRQLTWDWSTRSVPGDAEANRALVRPYRAPWALPSV